MNISISCMSKTRNLETIFVTNRRINKSTNQQKMIGHFTDDERALQFLNSNDLARLAPLGTSCPDHFLRTKISPLVLDLSPDADVADYAAVKTKLSPAFEAYRQLYTDYYNTCKHIIIIFTLPNRSTNLPSFILCHQNQERDVYLY